MRSIAGTTAMTLVVKADPGAIHHGVVHVRYHDHIT